MKLPDTSKATTRVSRLRYRSSLGAAVAITLALLSHPGGRIDAQSPDPCAPPLGNAIVCENQQPGAPSTEWDVAGAGDASIQGFATEISVNRGQGIAFKIDTDATSYQLDIYRMGYYGGLGARKVATVSPAVTLPQVQPACLTDATTGLVDCGNWATSATWTVPATAVSGIYFARVSRLDTGGASHILFVVRDDGRHSDLLFQTSDTTWQAYNQYGGNSLYVGAPAGRAYKVSYNRPITVRGTSPEDSVFNAEYPMVRWLEANGYDVSYLAGPDSDRRAAELVIHKTFLSVGHDEYWSGPQRANVEAARAAGVSLAFFSGNEVFWKTRWEPSISADATLHRTLVTYKETHADAKIDPSAEWTGTWRDPRFSPPADGGRPENALTGTIFTVNAGTTAIEVPAAAGKHRFWRNTAAAVLAPGASLTLTADTLGYEWDEDLDNGFRPPGLVRLSDTTVNNVSYLQDYGSTYAPGSANHALTLYRHSSGALVFGAGTVQWSWGLDGSHDRGASTPSLAMQQATVNLFADMSAQPLTLQAGLTSASASTDTVAPTSSITAPGHNASVSAGSVVTITGVAVDAGGGSIGGVEVSVDGGGTWRRATGGSAWTFSWATGAPRTVVIFSRAVDDTGNLEQPSTGITVHVEPQACPCSLWSPAQGPIGPVQSDPARVELGTRFYPDASGYVTGIRFFKPAQNTGAHTGSLWTTTGTRLSTVTFSAESASGWQEVTLPDPVAVTANTAYVVSYNSGSGFYAADNGYFSTSGVDASPLYAPPTASGPNGVFAYGPGQFPNQTFQGANYWVDVVFVRSLPPDATPPTVSVVSPTNGQSGVAATTTITVTFSENVQNVSATTFELTSGGLPVAASVSYASVTRSATLTPSGPLAFETTYTARVRGDASGVADIGGNPLAADYVWTFITGPPPPPPPDEGSGGPILIVSSGAQPVSRYYAEILRAEGLNDFLLTDIATLTSVKLAAADVVVLGHVPLSSAQVSMLTTWVGAGGKLIAMRPDKQLAGLLGLTDAGTTLSEGYLRVDTSRAPGTGIAGDTLQFHGTADRYTLNGAISVATLFTDGTTAVNSPAVTLRPVGAGGGQAASFAYDLAQSIVYTRQGNPAWSGQERDGSTPIRSSDLFFGGAAPDWIDFNKVAIPQADEQQRLLANMILHLATAARPLPRFWYFPRGEKAVVVMTGDDHGNNGTTGRFDIYKGNSPANCSVNDWECVRGTSYIYPTTPITDAQAAGYTAEGFEIAVHVSTGCQDYTAASLELNYATDLAQFAGLFPSLSPVVTNRTHCVPWSDYDTQPQVALAHGIRLDTNYYYYPEQWIQNRPGFMTGSGMPMRFTKADGTLIDVFQAATQMSDEAGQTWPFTIDTLLDRAIGPEGYYGFFVANMHTDTVAHAGSEAIVASALARSVPVISASQLLTWIDGRNASAHSALSWGAGAVRFTVTTDARANGLQTMLPAVANNRLVTSITRNGQPAAFAVQTIKGIDYAVFDSPAGDYEALYSADLTAPAISGVTAQPGVNGATITWSTSEGASGRVEYGTNPNALTAAAPATFGTSHSVPLSGLAPATTYYFRVTAADLIGNTTVAPAPPQSPRSFLTLAATCPCTIWSPAQAPGQPFANDPSPIEVGVKFKPLANGFATAVRFYKGPLNTGTHIGNLWSAGGTRLATVTFAHESATGWQEATLSQPVPLTANTMYVVSYHTSAGGYAADLGYFQSGGFTRGPLQALANGDGANGVFEYGASGFPTQSLQSTNYWVDLTFELAPPPPPPWGQTVTDTTVADFQAGAVGVGTFVARAADGEVILAPTIEDFSGTSVPAGWVSTPWSSGGVTTVTAGGASVDGALLGIAGVRQPAQRLEFVATFSSEPSQHGGFALDFQDNRWAMFSTGSGGGLLARTHDGTTGIDTPLPGNWLNAPHRFRVDWAASSVTFSIDGAPVATHSQAVPGPMRPIFSDFSANSQSLLVDAVQTGPYAQSGTFRSRVLDSGASTRWRSAVSTTQVPVGTTLSLSVRFGETPAPDAAWSPFASIPVGSALLNATSRYVQYQAALTGNGAATPVLEAITFGGSSSAASPSILSALDTLPGLARAAGFTIRGWAVDTRATTDTGISAVDIFATSSAGGSPIFLGAAALGGNRPDVAVALGHSAYALSGFSVTVSLPPGQYTISATPRSSVDAAFGAPATVQVSAISGAVARIQSPSAGRLPTSTLTVRGYAVDLDASSGTGVDTVQVWATPAGGAAPFLVGAANYGESRPELTDMFGTRFAAAGFSLSATLTPGAYTISTRAHSTVTGTFSAVDSVSITVLASAIELNVDSPIGPSVYQGFTVAGWARDSAALSGAGVDAVHVWGYPLTGAAPVFLGATDSFFSRPDVGQVRGAQFLMSGFAVKTTAAVPPGAYQVVTYARSIVSGTFDAVSSRVLTVLAAAPVFQITDVADGARLKGNARLNGFAFDPRATTGTGIDAIHMWVYPNWGSGQAPFFAGLATFGTESDPSLSARFGQQFARAGVHASVPLLNGPGTYMLAFYAHSAIDGTFTAVTRVVTVPPPQFLFVLDTPQAGATVSSPVRIAGWAVDRANVDQTPDGPGVEFVQIYAYPAAGGPPALVCGASVNLPRPDVAAALGASRFVNSGFDCQTPMAPGVYDLAVFLFGDRTRQYSPPSVFRFTVR
jgi:hypothetical protein